MNAPLRPPPRKAAKHKITLAEARRMWHAGVFPDYPDLELIDGELFEMPADGVLTISWNAALAKWLYASVGSDFVIIPDKTLPVTETSAPKPDFYIYPASIRLAEVSAANVSLVIEVSDSTFDLDRDVKARLYELGGVRDYWIVNCNQRELLVFRRGVGGTFAEPTLIAADQRIEALLIPGLAFRLDDLHLPA